MTKKIKACPVLPIPSTEDEARQARRIIATDALAWIKAGALIPGPNIYFVPTIDPVADDTTQARDLVYGKSTVCALGAILVGKVARFNDVAASVMRVPGFGDIAGALDRFFSREQCVMIEQAFEGETYSWHGGQRHELALTFYREHGGDDYNRNTAPRRLKAILKNIVEHGEFRP